MKDLSEISFPSVTWQLVVEHLVCFKKATILHSIHVCVKWKHRPLHSLISSKLSLLMDNYRTSLWHVLCKRDDGCYWRSLKKNLLFVDDYLLTIVLYILHAFMSVPLSISSSSFAIMFILIWRVYDLWLYYNVSKNFWIVEIGRCILYLTLLDIVGHIMHLFFDLE